MKPLITFITPTIGRGTLDRAIKSVHNQTLALWKHIIIIDEPSFEYTSNDSNTTVLKLDQKLGDGINGAGLVRNEGMKLVTTPWIGFIDDDDRLDPHYVEWLQQYSEQLPDMDAIIFRMFSPRNGGIIPRIGIYEIFPTFVGISFAIKKSAIEKYGGWSANDSSEDYMFLNEFKTKGGKFQIVDDVAYYTRH